MKLDEPAITYVAHLCSGVGMFDLANILIMERVFGDRESMWGVIENYKDPTSNSNEAWIQACLRYLNENRRDVLPDFLEELLSRCSLSSREVEKLNNYLNYCGLTYEGGEIHLLPAEGEP